MSINWTDFTPGTSLAGGLLIGLAASLFLLFNGRIAGITGILGGLRRPARSDTAWRLVFLGGLISAPFVYRLFAPLPEAHVDAGTPTLIIAGLLVGMGTRYGSGCTSGHGVCGLARRSPRSAVATLAFMLGGFVTVYIMRHLLA